MLDLELLMLDLELSMLLQDQALSSLVDLSQFPYRIIYVDSFLSALEADRGNV